MEEKAMLLGQRLEESINTLSELTAKVPKQIEMIKKEIGLCDHETSDLLHHIEMSNLNACEGYKVYKDMQITRKKRRELKDELDILEKLDERMNKHSKLITSTGAMTRDIIKQKSHLTNRRYHLRVRKDLQSSFESFYERQNQTV